MISKRRLLASAGGLICVSAAAVSGSVCPARAALPPIAMDKHEQYMRLAIEQGRTNPAFPFGAVIVKPATGETMATGANNAHANPVLHGEIVCINEYVARHGNQGWEDVALYTTGEPCPMCMTALIFARIGAVVYGSTVEAQQQPGHRGFAISAKQLVEAAPFPTGLLLGGVLASETDRMFRERK
jgi:tRNA(adenine34) deaminase